MKINLFLVTLTILIGFISCKKENEIKPNKIISYDTIEPLNYFPVYPGSFWKYRVIEKQYQISITGNDTTYTLVNQDTSFSEMATDSEYKIHSFETKSYYDYDSDVQIIEYSDSVYAPFLNDQPIYGYKKIDFSSKPPFGDSTYMKYPFLCETIGFEFISGWYDNRFTYLGPYYKVIDKTIDINSDSLIVVYGHYKAPDYKLSRKEWKYYYKNIGLKLHYSFDESIEDTIYKKELIDYNINK